MKETTSINYSNINIISRLKALAIQ